MVFQAEGGRVKISKLQRYLTRASVSLTPHAYMRQVTKPNKTNVRRSSVTWRPRRLSAQCAFPTLSSVSMSPRLKLEASLGGQSLDPESWLGRRSHPGKPPEEA